MMCARTALPATHSETLSRQIMNPGFTEHRAIAASSATPADPLPLVGRGTGWGSIRIGRSAVRRAPFGTGRDLFCTTPTPYPSPQGGGDRPASRADRLRSRLVRPYRTCVEAFVSHRPFSRRPKIAAWSATPTAPLPLAGRGEGWGSIRNGRSAPCRAPLGAGRDLFCTTPTPHPSPQGGGDRLTSRADRLRSRLVRPYRTGTCDTAPSSRTSLPLITPEDMPCSMPA
ncbi:hypothetical protein QO011_003272 [Labrys wisconsinensis]|uniref:Uncharacterized protein n=1 Tax=Labrys wisconsinensis TaxID=425677 RepID=A0ABU0J7L2_9HYPH|nr:hypothetical protein [Labrys wisconsinensis]